MKTLCIALAGLSIGLMSFKNMPAENFKSPEPLPTQPPSVTDMLLGKIEWTQLQDGEYGKWFNPNFKSYEVDMASIPEIKKLMDDVEVTTFMGTWCHDSKRDTPRFYKIMKAADVPDQNLELVAVDYKKTTPKGLEKGMNIERVPTFIFKKDGKELGRIVEHSVESLEKDMLKILRGEDYTPSNEK